MVGGRSTRVENRSQPGRIDRSAVGPGSLFPARVRGGEPGRCVGVRTRSLRLESTRRCVGGRIGGGVSWYERRYSRPLCGPRLSARENQVPVVSSDPILVHAANPSPLTGTGNNT